MPNWCNNDLIVQGDKTQLNHFVRKAKGIEPQYKLSEDEKKFYTEEMLKPQECELCFNQFVPVPKEILEQGFSTAGYNWQVDNWGTKWGASVHAFEVCGDTVAVHFDTAWSPPEKVIMAMSNQFPKLTFSLTYAECGMMFAGKLEVKAGRIIINEFKDFDDVQEYCDYTGEENWEEEEELDNA